MRSNQFAETEVTAIWAICRHDGPATGQRCPGGVVPGCLSAVGQKLRDSEKDSLNCDNTVHLDALLVPCSAPSRTDRHPADSYPGPAPDPTPSGVEFLHRRYPAHKSADGISLLLG